MTNENTPPRSNRQLVESLLTLAVGRARGGFLLNELLTSTEASGSVAQPPCVATQTCWMGECQQTALL